MFRSLFLLFALSLLTLPAAAPADPGAGGAATDWSFNGTAIEACSCPMFCQCYFNMQPAAHGSHGGGHGEEHFCRANLAYKVNKGHYGTAKLDGMKFWIANDLGAEFADGEMEWAVLHFEPGASKEQREAIQAIYGYLFPVKWKSNTVGQDAAIEWMATKDRAVAKLDGGKLAEVTLKRQQGNTDDPIVIQNLKYWAAPRNDGFVLMPNEVEAYRAGDKPFEFKGTNGFMITVDMNSNDFKKSPK